MATVAPDLLRVLACASCGGRVASREATLSCGTCGRAFAAVDGIPALRTELEGVSAEVRDFYSAAPFPGYPPRDSYASLRARAERSELARLLDAAIPPDAVVLDAGCGTGQMTLFLATAERTVVGADLTRASLELAAAAARRFGIRRAHFVETDLGKPGLVAGAFDVVYCSGVLHHTRDPRASFGALASLVRPGGHVVLGLYNAYARLPHRLRRAVARATGLRLVPFDPVLRERAAEPARREAWLRDQYRHPLEHRHTLAEVQGWFAERETAYVRSYPSTILGEAPRERGLFAEAADDWGFENVLQQLGWVFSLGREGGVFVVVGRRSALAAVHEEAFRRG